MFFKKIGLADSGSALRCDMLRLVHCDIVRFPVVSIKAWARADALGPLGFRAQDLNRWSHAARRRCTMKPFDATAMLLGLGASACDRMM